MTSSRSSNSLILLILGALSTVSPFSIDLYLPAFAQIAEDLHTTSARVSLSVSSYFIGLAAGQILYGPLLDRFGRKKPLYVGLSVYLVATLLCTQARSVEMLVAVRFLQALGGCVAWVGAMAMVRDFFPVEQSARVFSLLVLILGVSPLLAPTVGGFIADALGWQAVFIALMIIVLLIFIATIFYLPEGHKPDPGISLKPRPILTSFWTIIKTPQFYTYAGAGAFAFATLFIYVAGSPIIFMDKFHVTPKVYGGLFALLSVGFIGGSQVNIFLTRKYKSQTLFRIALTCQAVISVIFVIGAYLDWYGLYATLGFFFLLLTCLGILNPNASALALAPFSRNAGSAASLVGFLQIGVAALASSCVGVFNSTDIAPIIAILAGTSVLALVILTIGRLQIGQVVEGESVVAGH
jgi:DHA1 family bicyclomycin/chloramphenicol resistance-like MFS transporter